ncbi:MAG: glycoside hydrolase family 125 protein [Lutispora sp.]|jgi:hypothetical protein
MKKILTVPKEIYKNERILYAGNHYISLPEINSKDASIKSLNIISMSNKGLVQVAAGDKAFLSMEFYKNEEMLNIEFVKSDIESYYIPSFHMVLDGGISVKARIYADISEKGFVYELESSENICAKLVCNAEELSFLRFNSHEIDFKKEIKIDKWLKNPAINIYSYNVSLSLAFGGDRGFDYVKGEDTRDLTLILQLDKDEKNAFYISVNSDMDGASTTLIHLRRKGFKQIYSQLAQWLGEKRISYCRDADMERIINENLFFNYFFSIGKDMDSDRYVAMTSRSPRYYVSGAFWERDSFLWSFPAIKIIDRELYLKISREMILLHSKNAGDHAHYIDGTVLYPGFELDEAASYFILLEDIEDYDGELLRAIDAVFNRIEKEYDSSTGLYKTFLLPSDDPATYPFVTIDNVILWRGLKNLLNVYEKLGMHHNTPLLKSRIDGIYDGIYRHLTGEVEGKRIFLWSADGKGNYRLYNDPPGNLGLLPYYGFVDGEEEIFQNTISYYYSSRYKYYFEEANIRELACDHHPNTPSGLGLCGSLLNPIMHNQAIEWLRKAPMDYGLLSESFDRMTGEARTGVGFATGSGYLAYALYHTLIGESRYESCFYNIQGETI